MEQNVKKTSNKAQKLTRYVLKRDSILKQKNHILKQKNYVYLKTEKLCIS
jgi:hypothetical protein